MATYAININERSQAGQSLYQYLEALGVIVEKLKPRHKSSFEESQDDIKHGRVYSFNTPEEMFKSLGI